MQNVYFPFVESRHAPAEIDSSLIRAFDPANGAKEGNNIVGHYRHAERPAAQLQIMQAGRWAL
jgi:hypothetical protein